MFGKCVHSRSTAWVSYVILIAMLLPAISMTDDLMAMVAPTDGEQIARRYDGFASGQRHADLHVTLFQIVRETSEVPLAFLGNIEAEHAHASFTPTFRQLPQDRAPPLGA